MAHLPGLSLLGKSDEAFAAASTLGASVRGPFGEDGEAVGDVYQISNAVSLGKSERQIVALLSATLTLLVTDEQVARERLWKEKRSMIRGKVSEAGAALHAAQRLSAKEALEILSLLRLGAALGTATGVTPRVFNELLATLRVGVQFVSGRNAQSTFFEDTRRPALIRNKMRESRGGKH